MPRRSRPNFRTFDLGDGWYISRENLGSGVRYIATRVPTATRPLFRHVFKYRCDADAWIAAIRAPIVEANRGC